MNQTFPIIGNGKNVPSNIFENDGSNTVLKVVFQLFCLTELINVIMTKITNQIKEGGALLFTGNTSK